MVRNSRWQEMGLKRWVCVKLQRSLYRIHRSLVFVCKTLLLKMEPCNFPGGSDGKEYACNVGNLSSIPRSGRSPGEGNGNSLQYSCLENFMDRGAWWARVHGVTQTQTQLKRPSTHLQGYPVVSQEACRSGWKVSLFALLMVSNSKWFLRSLGKGISISVG